jgi:hypothetical protein
MTTEANTDLHLSRPTPDPTSRNLNFEFVRRQVETPPSWSSDILLPWEHAYPHDQHSFLESHYWTETGSVNVFQIVGTDHWDYQGKSWLDFLTSGKRMQRNLQALIDNPSYYLEPTFRRPAIRYNTVDGLNFYVGSDGNHRSCIARFFLAEQQISQLYDVTVNHYKVRENFHRIYTGLNQAIKEMKVLVDIYPKRIQAGREDAAGWKIDHYETNLVWHEIQTGEKMTMNEEQSQDKLNDLLHKLSTPAPIPTAGLLASLKRFLAPINIK